MKDFTTRNKRKRKTESGTRRLARGLLAAVFWLAVWQLVAMAVQEEILLVSPFSVFCRLLQLAGTGEFWQTVAGSMLRVVLGFLLAAAVGTLLAAVCSRSAVCRALFTPLLGVVKATPVASFILLALVWLSSARVPVLTAFLIALPVFWQNVTEGIAQTDPALLEMARVYGFGAARTLRRVYLPSVLPYFSAACGTGLGMAWKAGVAAEVLANTVLSIGGNLYSAKVYLETPDLFAWTAAVVLLSLVLEKGLARLLRVPVRRLMERGCLL